MKYSTFAFSHKSSALHTSVDETITPSACARRSLFLWFCTVRVVYNIFSSSSTLRATW